MTTVTAEDQQARRIRAERLQRRTDFDRIYRQGKRTRGKFITAVVLVRQGGPCCRAAYVVSRKVARQAVYRNRIRRRLREALRLLLAERGLAEPADIILIASPRALEATYRDLHAELEELLRRAKLWARPPAAELGQ